ncbi:MAG: FMN-binding protein [Clostridiales bacterium]|nr:FMN-binding protein [Clostridiales bacterium]
MLKKTLKITGIVVIILIVFSLVLGSIGKKEALNLDIISVQLDTVDDDVYEGNYKNGRWSMKVNVTVENNRIIEVTPIATTAVQAGRTEIYTELANKIIKEQVVDVDVVSGATANSNSFLKAVEDALTD